MRIACLKNLENTNLIATNTTFTENNKYNIIDFFILIFDFVLIAFLYALQLVQLLILNIDPYFKA